MRSRLWLVLLVLVLLVTPRIAIAEERLGIEIAQQPEVTMLGAAPVTPMSEIVKWFQNTRFVFLGRNIQMSRLVYLPVRLFTTGAMSTIITLAAAIFVFVWWGVRKVIRILFRSLRKGKINA